jgi:hypothetical protein
MSCTDASGSRSGEVRLSERGIAFDHVSRAIRQLSVGSHSERLKVLLLNASKTSHIGYVLREGAVGMLVPLVAKCGAICGRGAP